MPRYAYIQTDLPAPMLHSFVRQTSTCAFLLTALLEQLAGTVLQQKRWLLASTMQRDEITAVAALHRQDGYCLIHGTDDNDVELLVARLEAEHVVTRLSGEAEVIDTVLDSPQIAARVTRDETEHFMTLRSYEQKVKPDGNYRPAGLSDIPALRAYAAGYSAEHDVPFHCDWHRVVAERQAMVADFVSPTAPSQVAACLMRGVAAERMVLCSGVYTFPEFRGQGYATRLVANFCFEAALAQLDTCLYVGITNRPAYAAYRRVGFEEVSLYRTLYLGHPRTN